MSDMRDAFFGEIKKEAEKNKNIIIITNDMEVFALNDFKKKYPHRYIDVGVAEQNMINIAAGIASTGKTVVVFGILPFLIYRCFEQIKMNICSMNLPVIIAGIGTGLSFSYDGPTHHGTSDIATARSIPELNILSPSDPGTAAMAAKIAINLKKPVYCRIDKGSYLNYTSKSNKFTIMNGWTEIIKKQKINVLSNGYMLNRCYEVIKNLEDEKIKIGLLDILRIKPITSKKLLHALKNSKCIITIEEHSLNGGLGSAVSEIISDQGFATKLVRLGIKNEQVIKYGTRESLLEGYGLSNKKIHKMISTIFKKYN